MIAIELADRSDFNKVLEFYRACGYTGVLQPSDAIVIAKDDRTIVGAVRLCLENDVQILRGMQISPSMRRQKIGSQMLYFCLPLMQRQLTYCLPYGHLQDFYGQIGFQSIAEHELPIFIKSRFLKYQQDGVNVVAMIRPLKSKVPTEHL